MQVQVLSMSALQCVYWLTPKGTRRNTLSAVTLITGASTGFGRDAAQRLAGRGHRVIATLQVARNR